jgi:hypothetical protein
MFYRTEPNRNKCHEMFCIADSDAQRSAQKHISSLSGSFLLSFLVIARYGDVIRQGIAGADSYLFYFAFFRVTCK